MQTASIHQKWSMEMRYPSQGDTAKSMQMYQHDEHRAILPVEPDPHNTGDQPCPSVHVNRKYKT